MQRWWCAVVWATVVSLVVAVAGCRGSSDGESPPPGEFNFPIAVALDTQTCATGPCYLLVANNNFDLRYNAGTVQSFDLEKLHAQLQDCRAQGIDCMFSQPCTLLAGNGKGEVRMGAFAQDIVHSPSRPRVYIPSKSDRDLTVIDVRPDGSLYCGDDAPGFTSCSADPDVAPQANIGECTGTYRYRDTSVASAKNESLPSQPIAAAVGSMQEDLGAPAGSGDYVLVADLSGAVSLYVDLPTDTAANDPTSTDLLPALVDVTPSMLDTATNLVFNPVLKRAFMPSSVDRSVASIGVALGNAGNELRGAFAYEAQSLSIEGFGPSNDIRDIGFAPISAYNDGSDAFVLFRRPEGLGFGSIYSEQTRRYQTVPISSLIRLGRGPSRLEVIQTLSNGRTYVLASCYTSQDLYVVDVQLGDVVGVVRGFGGPFELVFDAPRNVLYVADFQSSQVRVVDLDPLARGDQPVIIGTIGVARPVEYIQ
jgi:hypothetical protein